VIDSSRRRSGPAARDSLFVFFEVMRKPFDVYWTRSTIPGIVR
jgi:hypothetical protein